MGGLTVIQDEVVYSNDKRKKWAYHIILELNKILALDFDAGIANQSITAKWRTSSGNFDGTEDAAAIPNSDAGGYKFDLGGGIYYTKRIICRFIINPFKSTINQWKGNGDDKIMYSNKCVIITLWRATIMNSVF